MAFSPTDVMPLVPGAKAAMGVQSLISIAVFGLVIARAVNIFCLNTVADSGALTRRLVPAEICRSAFTRLAASALVPGLGCGLKDRGDIVCGVDPPGCDVDYQVVGSIVGQCQAAAVESVEGDERR